MGWLEFISRIVGSIAWPAVVVVLLFILKPELRALFRSVQRVKYKDFEAVFSIEKAAELESKAQALLPATAKRLSLPAPRSADELLETLLRTSPRVAVIEAFALVEQATRDAAIRHGLAAEANRGVRNTLRELEARNLLSRDVISVFGELRIVRDELTHMQKVEISEDTARRYVNAAKSLAQSIGQL